MFVEQDIKDDITEKISANPEEGQIGDRPTENKLFSA